MTTGNVDKDNKNTNAKSTQPVASCQTGAHVDGRCLVNSFAYQLEVRRLKDRPEKRRQLVCDYAMGIFPTGAKSRLEPRSINAGRKCNYCTSWIELTPFRVNTTIEAATRSSFFK
jgi:hypothetical protein